MSARNRADAARLAVLRGFAIDLFRRDRRRPRAIGGSRLIRACGSLLLGCLALLGPAIGKASATTVVSLTFDDGRQTQYAARAPLAAHAMHGTFYVNSGLVGSTTSDWRMTWSQLHDLAADGNEIAGHTLTHSHLTSLSASQQQQEICGDRNNLLNQGFSPVLSFAYPYAEYDSTVESTVQQCGYWSARWVGGIRGSNCSGCPFAETVPPNNRWVLRTPPDIDTGTTLATMEGYVTQAESNGGGWVTLVIHSVCNGCDTLSVSVSQLTAFLDWLQPRAANGTVVQTVGDVISGVGAPPPPPPVVDTTPPVTTISCNGTGCARGWYRSAVTVALSATDAVSGVATTRYTTDGTTPTATNGTTYAGPFTVASTTTVNYYSVDNARNKEPVKSTPIRIRT
jgi:peptidoglycan/xylan/chitin deacetylase (PgdA/CDA1 family)